MTAFVCRVCRNVPEKSPVDGMWRCDTCNRTVIPVSMDALPLGTMSEPVAWSEFNGVPILLSWRDDPETRNIMGDPKSWGAKLMEKAVAARDRELRAAVVALPDGLRMGDVRRDDVLALLREAGECTG